MTDFLSYPVLGNSIYSWLIVLGIAAAQIVTIKLFSWLVIRKIKAYSLKTEKTWDDVLVDSMERFLIPLLYVSSIYFALYYLHFTVKLRSAIHTGYFIICTFFILRIISSIFKKIVAAFLNRNSDTEGKMGQAKGLVIIVNIIIWCVGLLFLFDNLGYNVTTLLAGIGIGGIAIALAAQTILGDLFSYFVIFFDRPFEIGDFIQIENMQGTIEQIGIKTTRIRTLGGEQLICSNTDLTNARVHNFKRLERRRIVFHLGVTYQTSHLQLKSIPLLIKNIIDSEDDVEFDRGHFSGFGDSSLNFEFVYYVLSSDFDFYMDKQHRIYLAIHNQFEQEKIDFAYPTQTIFIQSEDVGITTSTNAKKS